VEVDYLLNLLLLTKGRNTIESYFDANGEACIQPNALRIHGKFTESIDWDDVKQRFAITDRQVLELKSVAYEFKRTTTQEYNRAQREVNHPSNAPIHFAFPEFQTDPNGTTRPTDYDRDIPKCSICKTWKFPQEMGRKKWCCKGGWACLGTGRDVIPRSLESAVLHPRRTDRCRVELHMRGPDCPGLSRPSLRQRGCWPLSDC
jgi:hypothetical protein